MGVDKAATRADAQVLLQPSGPKQHHIAGAGRVRTGQAKRLQRVGKARSAISAQVIVGWRFHIGSARPHRHGRQADAVRSEEHTSELQSLMRISYAVFCLKKKK